MISRDDQYVIDELTKQQKLTHEELDALKQNISRPALSIHWEIKTLVSVGFGLFSVGLGGLIYDYLDSSIKWIILSILILSFAFSAWYCFSKKEMFSWQKVSQKSTFFDVILIFCTSIFLTLEGYLQYEFNIFGEAYTEMAIIPTIFYFFCAYYFDNKVILVKGMIAFTALFTINFDVFEWENFDIFFQENPVLSSIIIGISFLSIGYIMHWLNLKKHFKVTYLVFAIQLIMLALTTKLINSENSDTNTMILLLIFSLGFYILSVIEKNLVIVFTVIVYFYIALTVFIGVFEWESSVALGLYFLITGLLIMSYFIYRKKTYGKD